eukprot:GHRR01026898.1.p1 GENE.GHRR01026898.1~~GHRR01026898.1.p1  ORF type:complete len:205 (+),score=71.68 GHRR01026898.1:403-1017(+)
MQPFRFGAVSLTGGSHLRPPFGGQLRHSSQQHQQERGYRTVVVAAAATGTASILLHRHAQGNVVEQLLAPKEAVVPTDKQATLCQLPRELAEIICGAIGEIVQVACLFPLDTIKVRCQAGGVSARTVVKQLLASGSLGSVLRQLYAGVFGASLASVAVGERKQCLAVIMPCSPCGSSQSCRLTNALLWSNCTVNQRIVSIELVV